MDKETLLQSLAGTLDSNPQKIKLSEQQLKAFEEQPGFTAYLLDLIMEDIPLGIQIAGAIFFKNRVVNYWIRPENKSPSRLYLQDDEKRLIKEKLLETMVKTHSNKQIKLQLSTALNNILSADKWDGLIDVIKTLLTGNSDHMLIGLICLFEYSKNYRWSGLESSNASNPVLEDIANEVFPIMENLTNELLNSSSPLGDEMLYLITKIFKYTTFSYLPTYLQDMSKLGVWCHLHILIINKPLPESVMNETDLELRATNSRVKAVKWCFGNLHRILSRHGGGFMTKDKGNSAFAKSFQENFVPQILNAYWEIIENWSSKNTWLSEGSLYHMISFLERLVDTSAWELISDKLEAIIKHVILPTLNANEETIELYETDPEEYIRRFFNINRESNTADVASISFILKLVSKKFKVTVNLLLSILNTIFNNRIADRANLGIAMETEGALRILSTISYKLDRKSSPVYGQLDQVIHTFVYPELLPENSARSPWLTARACDTLALFLYKYQDPNVLQDIFQGVVSCFQNEEHFPIQLTAVDALRTLVDEDLVAEHVAEQAPQLMSTLLDMSKKFESDILTSVMDSFVEKFSKNLEPFALELSQRLVEQFISLASEMLSMQSNSDSKSFDIDKEYQAAGLLNSLITLVIAMNSSPGVAASLEGVVENMIKFILDNAMIMFLTEAIEILESILFTTQRVSPTIWELFQTCINSFDTYAFEYFDTFLPFFVSIINNGFTKDDVTVDSPHVQSLLTVCFRVLKSDSFDPIFAHSAFELIELTIVAMNTRFLEFLPRFLPEIFDIFIKLENEDAFDGHMLHHLSILTVFFSSVYVSPETTLQFLNEKQFTETFYKLWIKHSDDFQSVYGCKIQILASLSILSGSALTLIPQDLVTETVDLLISNLEALPNAIKAKNDILTRESTVKENKAIADEDDDEANDNFDVDFYDDEFEADEAELEAMKQTPLDSLNTFEVFAQQLLAMQSQDPAKYEALFGRLDDKKKELIISIVKISQQHQK